jgi:single-strand DNA-binding protein
MGSVNKVILVGNLGSDPEVRFTAGNQPVTHFNLATSESWRDKSGEMTTKTEWHRVVMWGKLAETAGQHLAKGRQIYVEGKLRSRSWEGKDGVKKYTTEVIADKFVFLGSKGDRPVDRQAGGRQAGPQDEPVEYTQPDSPPADPDDIPF